jgi:hypothetical protein
MTEESNPEEQSRESWYVDLGWYGPNRRSFFTLARCCLCPKCHKKLKADKEEVAADKLIEAIGKCCSNQPGYITAEMPVIESVFRILLANNNRPMDTAELGERLRGWRGSVPGGSSGNVLSRLLGNDRYYGISCLKD